MAALASSNFLSSHFSAGFSPASALACMSVRLAAKVSPSSTPAVALAELDSGKEG